MRVVMFLPMKKTVQVGEHARTCPARLLQDIAERVRAFPTVCRQYVQHGIALLGPRPGMVPSGEHPSCRL